MNIFRLMGDFAHLLSFFFLIHRLREKKTAIGISLKTQELYLLVFCTRYLDLFTNFYSVYNSVMKVVYIAASAWVVHMMRQQEPWKSTYEANMDPFQHWKFAVAPCAALALVFNEGSYATQSPFAYGFEVMWAFSIWLEAVAIFPQLVMTQKYKAVENLTSWYMASLGSYRALYLVNWIYRCVRACGEGGGPLALDPPHPLAPSSTSPHLAHTHTPVQVHARAALPRVRALGRRPHTDGRVRGCVCEGVGGMKPRPTAVRPPPPSPVSSPRPPSPPRYADFLYLFVVSKAKGHKHVILPT